MSVWKSEKPKEVKQYLVKYKAANNKIRVDVDWWHGDRWYWWGERVIKWAEIPEDEKEKTYT